MNQHSHTFGWNRMRGLLGWLLMLACPAGETLLAHAAPASPRSQGSQPSSEWLVKGRAPDSVDEARKDALRLAQERLTTYLREVRPDSTWTPPADEIRTLVHERQVQHSEAPREWGLPAGTMVVEVELNVPPAAYESALRLMLAHERQWLLGEYLFGVTLFFCVLAILLSRRSKVVDAIRSTRWQRQQA
jgi:hypothetical protein